MYRITKVAALAAVGVTAAIALGTAASAATINSNGTGFVGKGEVQSAMGWNNSQLQTAVSKPGAIVFTSSQPSSQALSSTATQSGSQSGVQSGTQTGVQTGTQTATQDVTETVTCTKSNGNTSQRSRHGVRSASRTGTRSATRDASRTSSRTGSRTGSRSGTVAGNITYTVDFNARQANQFTGFFLTLTPKPFAATGSEIFGEPTWLDWDGFGAWTPTGEWAGFGAWTPNGDYSWQAYTFSGTTTWGAWDTDNDPNADPDTCFNNGNIVPGSLTDSVVTGDIHDGDTTNADPAPGEVTPGETLPDGDTLPAGQPQFGSTQFANVTSTGPLALSVNGRPLSVTLT